MMTWQIPDNLSFEDALGLTETLIEQMEAEQLSEEEIQDKITALVGSMNGARGFFVTYLTSDRRLADSPSPAVLKGLVSSPEIVSELLVKNLAMSSAMAITHRRNHDEDMAKGSDQVRERTTHLIQQLNLDLISEKLAQLQSTINQGEGNYASFLKKWGYDDEQKQAMQESIEKTQEICSSKS